MILLKAWSCVARLLRFQFFLFLFVYFATAFLYLWFYSYFIFFGQMLYSKLLILIFLLLLAIEQLN